jgi:hypothetical protein
VTFHVHFIAQDALLQFVRWALEEGKGKPDPDDEGVVRGSACVLACAAALEAAVNDLIQDTGLSHWDELRLSSKIDTLAELQGTRIPWGHDPWQTVVTLIRVRNWLAHYKDPHIGLMGAQGEWVEDSSNKPPKIDPKAALGRGSVSRYFEAVVKAICCLKQLRGEVEDCTEALDQEFEPFRVG